jgi:hypothetical protein
VNALASARTRKRFSPLKANTAAHTVLQFRAFAVELGLGLE